MRISLALGPLAALAATLAPQAGSAQRAPAFSAKELTAPPTGNWITNGGNVYNR